MFLLFVIAGVIGGVLGGMGMGGGTLLIPILTVFLGVGQHVAQAVNLIGFIPMSAVALFIHFKKGLIRKDGIFIIIAAGLLSCAVFAFIAKSIEGETLKRIFGIFLIVLSFTRFFDALKKQ